MTSKKRERDALDADCEIWYDTYQFVGEERLDKVYYRVDTEAKSAAAIRDKFSSLLALADQDQAGIFAFMLTAYLRNDKFVLDDEENAEIVNELKTMIPDRSEWELVLQNKFPPLCIDWKNANVYVLNTWW